MKQLVLLLLLTSPAAAQVTPNFTQGSMQSTTTTTIDIERTIETEIMGCFGQLLDQLKSKTEQEKPLLDNTSILFGSNLGNANAHHAKNLPIFLAGGGFDHGQHIAKDQGTPWCNLFLTVLDRMGVRQDSFGQSTGTLSW